MSKNPFVFNKLDSVGASDAKEDARFLQSCFVDTGLLSLLCDLESEKQIVVGRTGSGKTALLNQMAAQQRHHAIVIEPENLAMAYVANSDLLRELIRIGVNLDLWLKLLWRHVLVVEVLRRHFGLNSPEAASSLWSKIRQKILPRDEHKHQRAIQYLERWGNSFWLETHDRVKELTTRIESDVAAEIQPSISAYGMSLETFRAGGSEKLMEESKRMIKTVAQHVINQVQMQQLSQLLSLLKEVLSQDNAKYYLIVDRLDEQWVSDDLRYLLIRALLETCREFKKTESAKVIVGIRADLIDRVFRQTRDAGFQQEKYDSLCVAVEWSKEELLSVLDKRVQAMVSRRYAKKTLVRTEELLPETVGNMTGVEYLLSRTLMRPRDAITFFNHCIQQSVSASRVSSELMRQAEGEYSRSRLSALADEWAADYPNLHDCCKLFRGKEQVRQVSDIDDLDLHELCLSWATSVPKATDEIYASAIQAVSNDKSLVETASCIAAALYKVGFLGLKLEKFESYSWSIDQRRSVSSSEILPTTKFKIHPAFCRALGIKTNEDR